MRTLSRKITILYVDDDTIFLELVTYSLARDPVFQLECVSSGAEALVRLERPGVHIILLDVMMPQMSGPDLLKIVHQRPHIAKTPVIFITAATMSIDRDQLMELGAIGIIDKPFDPSKLAEQIRRILGLKSHV
jgi:two-component system, OmpR family, response regulator